MRAILAFALCLAAVAAAPKSSQKIVGGSVATIDDFPSLVSLLYSWNSLTFWQTCVGTIINTRAILTTAHCPAGDAVGRWRVRVGSTYANSGGIVHNVNSIVNNALYDCKTYESDISIIRTTTTIVHNSNAMPATFAGADYFLGDNQNVLAVGWGFTNAIGSLSEQIRYVQIQTINHENCIDRYATIGNAVTDNMLCSGHLDNGGRGWCQGDNGGPLYHNGIVVGIYSWGYACADPFFPSVNVRISNYTAWLHANV